MSRSVNAQAGEPGPAARRGPGRAETAFSSAESSATITRQRTTRREDPTHATLAQATRGQLDGALRARDRADELRGLHIAGVLRARARGSLQASVAQRRAGRAAAAHRELFHQGARRRQDVRRRGEGEGRRSPRLLQHLPAPREQAGLERLPERGDQRHHPSVRVQVPRLALRPRRRLLVRPAGAGVLRPGQGGLRARPGALRRLGGLHLHQPGQGARAVIARFPRADGHQNGELPVREVDRALLLSRQRQEQLEALHGRLPGVLPRANSSREAVAAGLVERSRTGRLRGALLQDRRPAPSGQHGRGSIPGIWPRT